MVGLPQISIPSKVRGSDMKYKSKIRHNDKGFTLVEIMLGIGIVTITMLFTAPVIINSLESHRSKSEASSMLSSKLLMEKYFNRGLMAVNPVRFDPRTSVAKFDLITGPWSLPRGLTFDTQDIATFSLGGVTTRQDSFSLEMYRISYRNRNLAKESKGAIFSRCADKDIYSSNLTLASVLQMKRPFLKVSQSQCCKDDVCNICQTYSYQCCDSQMSNCTADKQQLPFILIYTNEKFEIFPSKNELLTNPGHGFVISFDDRQVRSYTLYDFRLINKCMTRVDSLKKECPRTLDPYLLDSNFNKFIAMEVSTTTESIVSDLSDGSYISIGDSILGD